MADLTKRSVGAVVLALGLTTACGDDEEQTSDGARMSGSETSDDTDGGSDGSESVSDSADTGSDGDDTGSEGGDAWSVTISGLEGTSVPLPPQGLGGPACAPTSARILCSDQAEPGQVFRVETDDDSAFDSLGEQTGLLLVSWGEPRYECISNFEDPFEPIGATFNVTSVDPLVVMVQAEVDCYSHADPLAEQFPAQLTAEINTIAPPI